MIDFKKILVVLFLIHSTYQRENESNSTHFIATKDWQEIKEGQKVPQGLHYRMNLQTGYKEAKVLEEENEKTSLLPVGETKDDEKTDVDSEIEMARNRLEAALKNIPSDKFDDDTEETRKEIFKKFRSYKELKEDLKDLELNMKSEMEIINSLVKEISAEGLKDEEKLQILEDIEYYSHNIDNSLHFISIGGVEKILEPNFNDSNSQIITKSMRTLAVILQNNIEAKNYVTEKTNIANYLINILSKSIDPDQQSTAIFAYGSLVRNNEKVIGGSEGGQVPSEIFKKGMSVLLEKIANQATSLKVSLKALTLIGDLLSEVTSNENVSKFIASLKMCKQLESFLGINRMTLISDNDSTQKTVNSLSDLKQFCFDSWGNSPEFRHEILVISNSLKSQLNSADEDSKFLFEEIVNQLEDLTAFLYDHLKISEDDFSDKYKHKNEL